MVTSPSNAADVQKVMFKPKGRKGNVSETPPTDVHKAVMVVMLKTKGATGHFFTGRPPTVKPPKG